MTILLTAVMDGNMKKQLLIISIIVVIVSIFVSCSVNKEGNIQLPSTTDVTDEQGTTHYYEPVTENESTSVFAEIVTDDKGEAVTKKNGKCVTKEHTTILTTAEKTISSTKRHRTIPPKALPIMKLNLKQQRKKIKLLQLPLHPSQPKKKQPQPQIQQRLLLIKTAGSISGIKKYIGNEKNFEKSTINHYVYYYFNCFSFLQ